MFRITSAEYSDTGGRTNNEDFILCGEKGGEYFFALADGLGGHQGGEIASSIACKSAISYYMNNTGWQEKPFDEVYELCQENLIKEQDMRNVSKGLMTTLNLICIDSEKVYWSHVGDSRTYCFKDKILLERTKDHSVSQMLALMGEIDESDIRFHEDRSRLLKALGIRDNYGGYAEEKSIDLEGNQQFLICSDGLWEHITEDVMQQMLKISSSPKEWLELMFAELLKNTDEKQRDNASAIAIFVSENDV